jgi:hypothetical protein
VSNKLNRIFIGSICNRDLELFDQVRKFCNKNYNISIIDLVKKGNNSFNPKYYKKQLKKYPISSIIVKLHSEESNQKIYTNLLKKFHQTSPRLIPLTLLKHVKAEVKLLK